MIQIENLVGGQWSSPRTAEWLPDINPATGEPLARVPLSGETDVADAVAAAEAAWPSWSAASAAERATHLMQLAALIRRDADALALDETNDTGKPLTLARQVDVPRAEANLKFFAGLIQGWSSQSHPMPGAINYTLRRALGAVGCISPWNLPLYLLTWKIAPALAAGNCVVAKPSELTPVTAYRLSALSLEAGLPPGVLNIVHGKGDAAGEALVQHPRIRAISFTGGTETGRRIASLAAPQFKRLSLELGGKNPHLVFADCDYDRMLETTVRSSFSNQGQISLCGSRILVEESLYDRFRHDLVERARGLRVGDPLSAETDLGSVISADHQRKIARYFQLAREEGGRILCGGETPQLATGRCRGGSFVAPTVIEGLGPDCRTNREEIFGPVVTLQSFQDDDEALRLANNSEYGLSAAIWTSRVDRALQLADRLQAGVLWVNCWLVRDLRTPFGGVKQSGLGREGGEDALRFFTEPKNVCVQYESSGG